MSVMSSGSASEGVTETRPKSVLLPTAFPGSCVPLGKVQTLDWHSHPCGLWSLVHFSSLKPAVSVPVLPGTSPLLEHTMLFNSRRLHSIFLIPPLSPLPPGRLPSFLGPGEVPALGTPSPAPPPPANI